MKKIEQVTIGGVAYNIAQASAIDQLELYKMISPRCIFNAGNAGDVPINADFVYGALAMETDKYDRIASIVLYKTYVNGTDTLVTIHDFQGSIDSYCKLVAEAVVVNLSDFFAGLQAAKEPETDQAAA